MTPEEADQWSSTGVGSGSKPYYSEGLEIQSQEPEINE
jgi:hypothetical protein